MAINDKKKYKAMEQVLQKINSHYISLPEEEVKRNNRYLEHILQDVLGRMKEQDALFNKIYKRIYYGGSYYDGLKVGKPEEYDLDILLYIPKIGKPKLVCSKEPGYVHVKAEDLEKLGAELPGIGKYFDCSNYLLSNKVREWTESLLQKVLKDYPKENGCPFIVADGVKFTIKIVKSGPAHTFKLQGLIRGKEVIMDIDLVPSILFYNSDWPASHGYKKNPVPSKDEFFIVPKAPSSSPQQFTFWRLSFQDQERLLMVGQRLKPTIRLLKKFRDNQNHNVASYFIKTILLLDLEKKNVDWDQSLSYCFMKALNLYELHLRNNNIPYLWNKNNNLVGKMGDVTARNIADKIRRVINDIDRHIDDPFIVAKYLLKPHEIEKLKGELPPGPKDRETNKVVDKGWVGNNMPWYVAGAAAITTLGLFAYDRFTRNNDRNT